MPQSLANVLVHLIFSTKNRIPFIRPTIEGELFAYLAAACNEHGCHAHKIGGTEDHVHIACSFSRTITLAGLLQGLKASSSKWMKTKGPDLAAFSWQNGYGAFLIGQSQLNALRRYITSQRTHHQRRTFQDEFRDFLHRYEVAYDERHVWD